MKKILVLTALSMLISVPAFATKYHCPSGDGNYNISTDIYDSESSCDHWKRVSQSLYESCERGRATAKQRYDQGKCVPITEKKHTIDGCDCTLQVGKNKVISTSCSGGPNCSSTSDAMKKAKKLYEN